MSATLADDTTPYACNTDLVTLLQNLENDTMSAITWFEINYMQLKQKNVTFSYQEAPQDMGK